MSTVDLMAEPNDEAWTYAPSLSDADKHTIYGPCGEKYATVYHKRNRARLIAAAPELLAALKHLVAYIEREGPAAMEWRAISEWATKGQAAIAKAEGK